MKVALKMCSKNSVLKPFSGKSLKITRSKQFHKREQDADNEPRRGRKPRKIYNDETKNLRILENKREVRPTNRKDRDGEGGEIRGVLREQPDINEKRNAAPKVRNAARPLYSYTV